MVDYIRGKKTYTKWDTDTDNVDIEYLDSSLNVKNESSWLSGRKGRIIKILILLLLFSLGVVTGYLIKKRAQEEHENNNAWLRETFSYESIHVLLLQQFIQPSSIKDFLKHLSERPRIAGTLYGSESASVIQSHWESLGLQNVRSEKYNVLLSYPSQILPNTVKVFDNATGETLLNITNNNSKREVKPFFAYSPSGKAEGHLVYANYGRLEDFSTLQRLNVSVGGNILLMKFGFGHPSEKVRLAAKLGAVGVLLYPDPKDYVGQRLIFPDGTGLPKDGVIFGNVKPFPGDPLTPRFPSLDSAYRTSSTANIGLPAIISQPISYQDAEELFKLMGGSEAPESWIGDINVTYRLGPGFLNSNNTYISFEVNNELLRKDILNVIGVLPGESDTAEYVIVGSHHDTWTTGASDPLSGMAVLMELVKAFGQLSYTGWKPKRSIVFASWDAEEFGIIGSTEWVEDHFKELVDNAVAYINIDSTVVGGSTLVAHGSPLLQKALFDAAKWVSLENENKTVYDQLFRHQTNYTDSPTPSVDVLGTEGDFVSFMSGYGISSLHIEYVNEDLESKYPLYHTDYDIYDVISKLVDKTFLVSTNLARVLGTTILSLADFLVLPFDCMDYVIKMEHGVKDLKQKHGDFLNRHGIHLDILDRAIAHFGRAANLHITQFSKMNGTRLDVIQQFNKQLMQVERTFILPRGVRNSPIFRHAIFGPHPHDLNVGVVFPGIVDSVVSLQNDNVTATPSATDLEGIKDEIAQVVNVIRAAGNMLINSVLTHYTSYPFL